MNGTVDKLALSLFFMALAGEQIQTYNSMQHYYNSFVHHLTLGA